MLLSRNLGILPIVATFFFGQHNAASAAESDSVELSNLASCYADGIDLIGNGKSEAGANRWRQCFAEDLKFTLIFGTSFSMTCPGEKCPMPASISGVDRRSLLRATHMTALATLRQAIILQASASSNPRLTERA